MKWSRVAVVVGPLALVGLGASSGRAAAQRLPPKALVDARSEFQQAKGGVAIQLDPTDVHEADLALQKAEAAWSDAARRSEHDRPRRHRAAQGADRRSAGAAR